MGWTPRRRKPVVVREIGDEILAYDLSTHRASCLNRGAAEVFRACDGLRSPPEIAALVGERLDCRVGTRYVEVALERLVRSGLVESPPALQPGRREALRRLAATAALALPAVTTVLAPEPAQAQTCLPNGSNCLMSGDCCSGCCMSNNQMCSGGTVLCLP
jgi:hypothetical protein